MKKTLFVLAASFLMLSACSTEKPATDTTTDTSTEVKVEDRTVPAPTEDKAVTETEVKVETTTEGGVEVK